MDQRILDLERTVEELSEEVRYLRGEVARLRRLVPGGASGNTPFSSPAGGRDRSDEAAVNASYPDSSYSVISQPERPVRGCLSLQVRERFPGAELGFTGLSSFEVHFVLGGARSRVRRDRRFCSSRTSR